MEFLNNDPTSYERRYCTSKKNQHLGGGPLPKEIKLNLNGEEISKEIPKDRTSV